MNHKYFIDGDEAGNWWVALDKGKTYCASKEEARLTCQVLNLKSDLEQVNIERLQDISDRAQLGLKIEEEREEIEKLRKDLTNIRLTLANTAVSLNGKLKKSYELLGRVDFSQLHCPADCICIKSKLRAEINELLKEEEK